MDEIVKIKTLVSMLEERILELETENVALKTAIISACDSLMDQNTTLSMRLTDGEKEISYEASFKQPSWKSN